MKDSKMTIGEYTFWKNLSEFQDLDGDKNPVNVKQSLEYPMRRSKKRLLKVLNNWEVVMGLLITILTIRVLIEQLIVHKIR